MTKPMVKGEKVRRTSKNILQRTRVGHIAAVAAVCLFASCTTDVAYHHYEHVDHAGWDKRDTVRFMVDTIRETGVYDATLCLRTSPDYPYRNISMRVFEEARPSGKRFARRMDFCIVRKNGTQIGQGINFFTNEVPVGTLSLKSGDTLFVKVGHNMRNETLQGVQDIGIKLKRR